MDLPDTESSLAAAAARQAALPVALTLSLTLLFCSRPDISAAWFVAVIGGLGMRADQPLRKIAGMKVPNGRVSTLASTFIATGAMVAVVFAALFRHDLSADAVTGLAVALASRAVGTSVYTHIEGGNK